MNNDLYIRLIKLVDICFITLIFFIPGFYVATILDKFIIYLFGNNNQFKSKTKLMFELVIQISLIGIITYLLKNIIENIPFPLDGYYGFKHNLMPELKSGAIITLCLIQFQKSFIEKLNVLRNKI